ncbi:hypothetical protein [Nonomuraea typhae]|uniref:Uncharacterized protein n=1 Tax=Nonomuraea typhae TaxID=2603600 RepID=A0ABW7YWH9_9ACTN
MDWVADPPPAVGRISSVLAGWRTARTSRRVLFVIHSVTAATRLADLLPIFQDQRIQLFCTQTDDSMFPAGVERFMQNHGFLPLTWNQALALEFHAVITASLGDNLHEIGSPILRIPHGNGYNKYWGQKSEIRNQKSVFGLAADTLKHDERIVPAAIALSHGEQFERLAEGCPDALPRAFVAGDPCYDRLLASAPRRLHYRHALGLRPDLKLITIASTWREDSLFGLDPLLVSRLLSALPYDRYRVALILHPNIWAAHSGFQIKAWLAEAMRAGLILLPPEEGWRAAIIAADWVLSDHGSVGVYAAALGRPILLDKSGQDLIDPRSALGRLLAVAPALDPRADLLPQLRRAEQLRDRCRAVAATWISSAPGRSLHLIREQVYRMMDTAPPGTEPALMAVGTPEIDDALPASLWTHVERMGCGGLSVRRWPASITRSSPGGVLIVSDQELDHRLVSLAGIIRTTSEALPCDEETWSSAVFEHRSGVGLTLVHDEGVARLRTRDGSRLRLILTEIDKPQQAELVFAVLAERLISGTEDIAPLSPLTLRTAPDHTVTAAFEVHASFD